MSREGVLFIRELKISSHNRIIKLGDTCVSREGPTIVLKFIQYVNFVLHLSFILFSDTHHSVV